MKLLWIRYATGQQTNYGLFLLVGEDKGDLIVLKSKAMDQGDIRRIRSYLGSLERATLPQRIEWLKQFCPTAYRKAFRRLPAGKYHIISEHQPKR